MKIYCAGVGAAPDIFYAHNSFRGVRCFISYYDMKERGMTELLRHQPEEIVCDSGAHAYFARTSTASATPHLKAKGSLPPINVYLDGYLKFIQRYKNVVTRFVELDTQEIHGKQFQKDQRDAIKKILPLEQFMPVWHANETEADWDALLAEYPYVGIEGIGTKRIPMAKYIRLIKKAYERNVKVHAFACVKKNFLNQVPVYSTDSSGWSSFYRYGSIFTFDGQKPTFLRGSHADKNVLVRGLAKEIKTMIFNKEYFQGVGKNILDVVLTDIRRFENYLTALWRARGVVWK